MKRLIRNLTAFLYGFLFIVLVVGCSEAFALELYANEANINDYRYSSAESACQGLEGTSRGSTQTYSDFDHVDMTTALSTNKKQVGWCYNMYYENSYPENLYGPVYSKLYGYIAQDCAIDEEWSETTGQCEIVDSPETCEEQGKLWDKRIEACVDACPYGQLDGKCLEGEPVGDPNLSDDGTECTPDSPDYKGIFEGKAYCDSNLPEPATCPEGEMAYIINDDGSGAYACGAPIKTPEEAPQEETETTTTTTDENGNTVTTTTDNAGNTTTTTTDPSGNSSTTINYNGTDSETGEPCSASSVSCYETPDTEKGLCKDGGSLCDDVNDIKKALEKKSDRTTKTGEFPTETEAKVAAAESELSTGLDQIKAEIGGYFDLALTAGDMVCGPGVEVLGRTIQICPSTMKDQLAVIAQIVLLMAALISLMIVFR